MQGFRDLSGEILKVRNEMVSKIVRVYGQYGYEQLETPAVEKADAIGAYLPDVDRPNSGVFAWDVDDELVALRYDLTAPLSRYVADQGSNLPLPYRRYSAGPVWRNEKAGPGRFRQFWQCDADIVGARSIGADADICMMLREALLEIGLKSNEIAIRISNRKLLNGILEIAGIDPSCQRSGLITVRAIDKLDRLGLDGVEDLLGTGRRDESGSFTQGANLSLEQQSLILDFVRLASEGGNQLENARSLVSGSQIGLQGIEEIEQVFELIASSGASDSFVFDPSIVRGLGYYTGTVFEADLVDAGDLSRSFGSIAGGGRYDNLVSRPGGQDLPSVGVSIGVDRLIEFLMSRGCADKQDRLERMVVVTVMDKSQLAGYQEIARELRASGVRCEVYYGNPRKFGAQMKYADQIGAALAIVEGGDERTAGEILIKDLDVGRELSGLVSQEEWKSQPQQVKVSRSGLVPEVLRMLSKS